MPRLTATLEGCAVFRVLATSDLHAHLRSYDYSRDLVVDDWGLTRLATKIAQARAEVPVSILLDNGDFLQGTPLAQHFSALGEGDTHPVIEAMTALRYDAVGLGNHEFSFGLERLDRALADARMPVLCANMLTQKGDTPAHDVPLRPARVLLNRQLRDPVNDALVPLNIGITSVLPTQVMNWDGAHLAGRVEARDMVESAAAQVAQLRADGADIVLLLAHTGIEPLGDRPGAENAAVALAQVPGVDAMITGHTHRAFPDGQVVPPGIDGQNATVFGVPTVMPGYRGARLGVIDLFVRRAESRWVVEGHACALHSALGAGEDAQLMDLVEPAHQATLRSIGAPLGQSKRPIHSYLSQIRDDFSNRLVAASQREAIKQRLAGTAFADLPLLSASAPFQTGGRAGPSAYVDIAAGPLTMRDASCLYPFPNILCAVRATGAEIEDWLERAASSFDQIVPGRGTQRLVDPSFPGHAVDTVYGLTYRINVALPRHYDENGERMAPDDAPPRIVDLAYEGVPVASTDEFIVAMSGYRAFGGGPYAPIAPERIVLQTDACGLKSLAAFLAEGGADRVADAPSWTFVPVTGARGTIETGPGILQHGNEIARLRLQQEGATADGFLRFSASMDRATCESAA